MSLILASASPRRRELLRLITTEFTALAGDLDESAVKAASPKELALALGRGKCEALARRYPADTVIGCDTVVDWNGQVFGKPRDARDARRMLRALSGADHLVHTGVWVSKNGRGEGFAATTRVRFYPLSDRQIEDYIATGEPFDKAGGYGIQGAAALFCEEIEGCYYNIMGLPVSRLARLLRKF